MIDRSKGAGIGYAADAAATTVISVDRSFIRSYVVKFLTCLAALTLSAVTATAAMAQNTGSSTPAKPIIKTTCAEYIDMKETIKPEFIYYTIGHSKHGKKDAVFDEVAVEKIKPELDEYCKVNLTKSAYDKVIASSIASEQAVRGLSSTAAK